MHLGIHYRSGMRQHEGKRVGRDDYAGGYENSELQGG